ncbi:hypothetical protein EI42_04533 [Thermosporothrix hazakensis]|uniref:Uncharacterized protein n=1 Tax=Thermosporothrix hazakensis TaxID=644383 RepID=A0A326U2I8_THEHA|nr:hypothetical protein EI42_04533 [Thermosporothrix hazakensis]
MKREYIAEVAQEASDLLMQMPGFRTSLPAPPHRSRFVDPPCLERIKQQRGTWSTGSGDGGSGSELFRIVRFCIQMSTQQCNTFSLFQNSK